MTTLTRAKRCSAFVGVLEQPPAPKTSATAEAGGKKRHFYKPLPTRFRHDGFDYRLIARKEDAAMYEQSWNGCANRNVCYEVIRIRRRDGFQIGGRFVEPAEIYPNSEAWGTDGWTVKDKPAASHKLREIATLSNAPTRQRQAGHGEKSPT